MYKRDHIAASQLTVAKAFSSRRTQALDLMKQADMKTHASMCRYIAIAI